MMGALGSQRISFPPMSAITDVSYAPAGSVSGPAPP